MEEAKKFDDLKFVRVYTFSFVPRYLLEQVEEMDKEMINRVYKFGSTFANSPLTLLYVLVDEDYKIKGVLWARIDVIEAIIYVYLFSVDKEYQSADSLPLKKAMDFIFNLPLGPLLKKHIRFLTSQPKAYERIGVKRAKMIMMEIDYGTYDKNNKERGNSPDTPKSTKP